MFSPVFISAPAAEVTVEGSSGAASSARRAQMMVVTQPAAIQSTDVKS
jgi:hypothetical protein